MSFFGDRKVWESREEWVDAAIEAGKLKFGESAVDEIELHSKAAGELYDVMEHFYKTDKKYFLKETIVMSSLVAGLFNQHLPENWPKLAQRLYLSNTAIEN